MLTGSAEGIGRQGIAIEWDYQPSVRVAMEHADYVARVRVVEQVGRGDVDWLPAERFLLEVLDGYGGSAPESLTLAHPDPDAVDWSPAVVGLSPGDEAVAILLRSDPARGSGDPAEVGVMVSAGEQGWLVIDGDTEGGGGAGGATVTSLESSYPSLTDADWPTEEPDPAPTGIWRLEVVEALAREVNASRTEGP